MYNTLIIILGLAILAYAGYRILQVWNERFAGRSMREQERELALLAELQKARTEAPETILVMDPPLPKKRSARPAGTHAATHADPGAGGPGSFASSATVDTSSSGNTLASSPATTQPSSSPAVLDAAGRVVFYILKIALPDHEILARVDTAALVGANEAAPPRAMIDFVVCQRDFSPVAVIVLQRGEDPLRERAAALLEQRGLRVLRWAVTALPDRARVREIVLGMA